MSSVFHALSCAVEGYYNNWIGRISAQSYPACQAVMMQHKVKFVIYLTLCSVSSASPCVYCHDPKPGDEYRGSLILRTKDNSNHTFHYNRASLDCEVENLPEGLRVSSLEVTSSTFTLFSKKNGIGSEKTVETDQTEIFDASEIKVNWKVKSIRRNGCTDFANLALIVICAVALVLILTLAIVCIVKRRRNWNMVSTLDSDSTTV